MPQSAEDAIAAIEQRRIDALLTADIHALDEIITFPRNKNAALPVRAQKNPLTLSGLKKMGPGGTFGHELSRPKRVS